MLKLLGFVFDFFLSCGSFGPGSPSVLLVLLRGLSGPHSAELSVAREENKLVLMFDEWD